MVSGPVVTSKQNRFPQNSEDRYDAVLATINRELKSATVTYLGQSNHPQTGWEIRGRHKNTVGNGWIPQAHTFAGLCHNTLYPIGCVAEEHVERDQDGRIVKSWKLTEDGEYYCLPVARFAMRKAIDFDLTMFRPLGSTSSTGKSRSPKNRADILEKLHDLEEGRKADLGDENIKYGLQALHSAGLIEYQAVSTETGGWAGKRWTGRDINDVRNVSSFPESTARRVASLFQQRDMDYREVHDSLPSVGLDLTLGSVAIIVQGLERSGFLQNILFDNVTRSKARITPLGRRYVDEFLRPVKRFLSDESVPEISGCEIDSEVIGGAIRLYEPFSNRETQTLEEHLALLRTLSEQCPTGVRPIDFARESGMSKKTAASTLADMHTQGMVVRSKDRRATYYKPRE